MLAFLARVHAGVHAHHLAKERELRAAADALALDFYYITADRRGLVLHVEEMQVRRVAAALPAGLCRVEEYPVLVEMR